MKKNCGRRAVRFAAFALVLLMTALSGLTAFAEEGIQVPTEEKTQETQQVTEKAAENAGEETQTENVSGNGKKSRKDREKSGDRKKEKNTVSALEQILTEEERQELTTLAGRLQEILKEILGEKNRLGARELLKKLTPYEEELKTVYERLDTLYRKGRTAGKKKVTGWEELDEVLDDLEDLWDNDRDDWDGFDWKDWNAFLKRFAPAGTGDEGLTI